ncbi:MAG: flagellar protein FlaG [Calditrichae bacterium]|nr:flagellar protein FlaG [Calditrichota bacterium]MCB9059211.1 flagellar protein FlaG [Calditrichia bacterium]
MDDIRINGITGTEMIPQVAGSKKIKAEIPADTQTENEKFTKNTGEQPADLDKIIEHANKVAKTANKEINFQVNEQGEPPTIIVTDKQTGKVIRQIPSEEMMRLSDRMDEFIGLIFNGRV